jgi:hypothetical protein
MVGGSQMKDEIAYALSAELAEICINCFTPRNADAAAGWRLRCGPNESANGATQSF